MDWLQKFIILLLLSAAIPIARPQQAPIHPLDPSRASETLQLSYGPLPPGVIPTTDTREGLIHLDITATGENGNPVKDLTAAELTLLQDGTPARLLSFYPSNSQTEDESLTEVTLVLDEVDLTPDHFALTKLAAIHFLQRNHGILEQPVSLLWIKQDGTYSSALPTTDGLMLAQDLASEHFYPTVRKPHGKLQPNLDRGNSGDSSPAAALTARRNALWNEVFESVYSRAIRWRDKPGRKALVWLGYGWLIKGKLSASNGPFPLLVELATRIREARMVIYEITPWPDPDIPITDKIPLINYRDFLSGIRSATDPALIKSPIPHFALPVLATQSGGLVLNTFALLEHAAAHAQDSAITSYFESNIARCIADSSAFYTISFDPSPAAQPDEYHDLSVHSNNAQTSVRTTYGYYNQPVFYDQPRILLHRLTVGSLQQLLTTDHEHKLSATLSGLELTERLSSNDLAVAVNRTHSKGSRAALTALADVSAFLAPPPAEISNRPAPDANTQQQIIQRAEKYLDTAVPSLPDFSADAITLKYEQPSPSPKDTWKTALPNQTLAQTVTEKTALLYRNGHEQQTMETEKDKRAGKRMGFRNDMTYQGIFGPVLAFVLRDLRRGNGQLLFSRWEQTSHRTLAVFGYNVPVKSPRYRVGYCCLADGRTFMTLPEHYGELAIDPDSGAVFRITVRSNPGWIRETDLTPLRPVLFSDMMVEYGPTNIGGHTFICPHRSVAIVRNRTVRSITVWGHNLSVDGPYQTFLNDTTYRNYHKFGSESRILPGFVTVP